MAQPDPAGNVPETATRTVSVTDTKMPYLEMLNITSDNANNTRATINDTLTITLETNETLAGANITALNGTFQMITENDTVTVNIPVTVNHSTGNVTFNITARDAQNHTLYVTDANLTSGYVFVMHLYSEYCSCCSFRYVQGMILCITCCNVECYIASGMIYSNWNVDCDCVVFSYHLECSI